MHDIEFIGFPKISRLKRSCVITEKIDGTNAQIYIGEDGRILAGSRNRWVTPESDNFGWAAWVKANEKELLQLGPGRHYGEWWGQGIQRRYGLSEKRFSLFNSGRWSNPESGRPACCGVVPVLHVGPFTTDAVNNAIQELTSKGSVAAPGFMDPEGVVVFHTASGTLQKVTCKNDETRKELVSAPCEAATVPVLS